MEDLKLYLGGIVCVTCLSSDRNLFEIQNVPHIQGLLPKLQFNMENDRICWECHAIVYKFIKFQERAFIARETFQDFVEGHLKALQTISNLKWVTSIDGKTQQRLDTSSKIVFNSDDSEIDTVNLDDAKNNTNIGYVELVEVNTEANSVESNWQCDLTNELDDVNIPDDFEIDDEDANKLINVTLKALLEVSKKGDTTDNIIIGDTNDEDEFNDDTQDCVNENETDGTDDVMFKLDTRLEQRTKEISRKILKENERGEMINREKQHASYRNATFKCEKCVYGYDTLDEYFDHMKKHDEKRGSEVCGICEQRFTDKATLTDHWSRHYTAFYCTGCGYTSRFHKFVVSHQKKPCERAECPVWYQCDICHSEFAMESLLNHHKSIIHKTEHKFKHSEKKIAKRDALKPQEQSHKSRMNMKCPICSQICLGAKSLQIHMRSHNVDAPRKERDY